MVTGGRILLGAFLVFVLPISSSPVWASASSRLYLVDSQFNPPVSRIYQVDPTSAALVLKADLGVTYTPFFGMAAADAATLYLTGTDTSPANLCTSFVSCLLLRVVLDPGSTTPAETEVIGVLTLNGNMVGDFTGLTFRSDGRLYGISQETDSLYRIDPATAHVTLVGSAGIDLHGGDISFDDQDRLWVWTNIGAGDGLYQMDPETGQATPYELHPNLDFSGMAALGHGSVLYGANAPTDKLYALDLFGGLNGGTLMTLNGQPFDHRRGDLDSPYCDDDGSCADEDLCTSDTCSPGGCLHSAIAGCCLVDAACDDGNACTRDLCQANQCVSTPLVVDDGNPCTEDLSDPLMGTVNLQVQGCCLADPDCDDFIPCTADACEGNRCVHGPVEGCVPPPPDKVHRTVRGPES